MNPIHKHLHPVILSIQEKKANDLRRHLERGYTFHEHNILKRLMKKKPYGDQSPQLDYDFFDLIYPMCQRHGYSIIQDEDLPAVICSLRENHKHRDVMIKKAHGMLDSHGGSLTHIMARFAIPSVALFSAFSPDDISVINHDGDTVLHELIYQCHDYLDDKHDFQNLRDVINMFEKRGANTLWGVKNKHNLTPLDYLKRSTQSIERDRLTWAPEMRMMTDEKECAHLHQVLKDAVGPTSNNTQKTRKI